MKTECPHCGQFYEVDPEYVDEIVECTSCGQEFVVERQQPILKKINSYSNPRRPPMQRQAASYDRTVLIEGTSKELKLWLLLTTLGFFLSVMIGIVLFCASTILGTIFFCLAGVFLIAVIVVKTMIWWHHG